MKPLPMILTGLLLFVPAPLAKAVNTCFYADLQYAHQNHGDHRENHLTAV